MIKLLSLFSGIGAFEKALTNLGVQYEVVNYCEIDKYASKSYSAIHGVPESKNLWDITKVDAFNLPKDIDLLTYGFPCQDISLAGKQKGMFNEDGTLTRSGLFFKALDVIECVKPKIAIAENVKALTSKKFTDEFKIVLDSLEKAGYHNYWQVLNAKDYGIPQNRERVFIVSIRKDIDHYMFEFPKPYILEKRLKDFLEPHVDEKYYLSDKMISYISATGTANFKNPDCKINLDIARPLTTDQNKRAGTTNYICDDLPDNFDLQNECLKIKEATKKGYTEAQDEDGVYINRPHQKRGVVQKGMIQTIKTSPDIGVVVKDESFVGKKYKEFIEENGYIPEMFNPYNKAEVKDIAPTQTIQCGSTTSSSSVLVSVPLKRGYSVEVKQEAEDTTEIDVIGNYSKSNYNATQIVGKNGIAPTVRENHGQVTATIANGDIKPNLPGGSYKYLVKDKLGNEILLNKDTKQLRETIQNCELEQDKVLNLDLYNRASYEESQTITEPHHNSQRVFDGLRIRKLTPKECFRLMGFYDEDFSKAEQVPTSNAQLYKQAGNSIVVNVLEEILKELFINEKKPKRQTDQTRYEQLTLF